MQKKTSPLISIIIPFYNRAHTLKRALDSVYAQDFKNYELILINDGSTDEFQAVLNQYDNYQVFTQENLGVSSARNLGIKNAKGAWMAFLDSDDEWLPKKLSTQVKYLQEYPEIKFLHTEEIWMRNLIRVNPHKKHYKSGGDLFKRSIDLCCISPSSVMIEKNILIKEGLFREDFPVCEDYDLWLKLTAKYPVGFIEEPLIIKYGGHSDQLSAKLVAMDYFRIKAIDEILQSGLLDEDKYNYAVENLLKRTAVLLKGYIKHDNLENYAEVKEIESRYIS